MTQRYREEKQRSSSNNSKWQQYRLADQGSGHLHAAARLHALDFKVAFAIIAAALCPWIWTGTGAGAWKGESFNSVPVAHSRALGSALSCFWSWCWGCRPSNRYYWNDGIKAAGFSIHARMRCIAVRPTGWRKRCDVTFGPCSPWRSPYRLRSASAPRKADLILNRSNSMGISSHKTCSM